jgi:hypothetical protein
MMVSWVSNINRAGVKSNFKATKTQRINKLISLLENRACTKSIFSSLRGIIFIRIGTLNRLWINIQKPWRFIRHLVIKITLNTQIFCMPLEGSVKKTVSIPRPYNFLISQFKYIILITEKTTFFRHN